MAIELVPPADPTEMQAPVFPCYIIVLPLNVPGAMSLTGTSLEGLFSILQRALNVLPPETQEYKDFIGLVDHVEGLLQHLRAQVH